MIILVNVHLPLLLLFLASLLFLCKVAVIAAAAGHVPSQLAAGFNEVIKQGGSKAAGNRPTPVLESIKHFNNGAEIVGAIERSFEGFTLNSHLDVVIVSDLIDGSTAKEVETLVSSLSKRLAHSSPFRFVREKIVFHINRDATVLSQISRLYSNSRLASPEKTKTPDVAAAAADSSDQANNIPAKAISAVPRASMEAILSDHFALASTMTTLYVIMIKDAMKKFDVSYTTSLGFRDSGSSASDGNSNSCRRKAFISDSKGFAWIDVFAKDDNLVFVDSFREYDNLDFKTSFSKFLSTDDLSPSSWIYHISNIVLQSSEYLISYPSKGLTHNSGIYNSSSTNRIDILIITICEEEPCEHDDHAFSAAESIMKTYTIPHGSSQTGPGNNNKMGSLDFSIAQVKFSLLEHPSLMVACMQSISFPRADIPESIRFRQSNVFKNTVEKRIHSKKFLSTLMESRLFRDTIIKHLPLDVNGDSVALLPIISFITSASRNLLTSDAVGGDKGTVAIDSDQFHWNNVVSIREMPWKYKVNSVIFESEVDDIDENKKGDYSKNSNNLPETVVILAYSKSYSNINGNCNSSILCDGVAIPFSSGMLPELTFYAMRGAIIGEDSLLSHYSKTNHRYTLDTTWYTPAASQANPSANKRASGTVEYHYASTFRERRYLQRYIVFSHFDLLFSRFISSLQELVAYDHRVNFNEFFRIKAAALGAAKKSEKQSSKLISENMFDVLNLQSTIATDIAVVESSNSIYERFVYLVREASLEYSYLEYSAVMNTLRSLDGMLGELEAKVTDILTRRGSIVCE